MQADQPAQHSKKCPAAELYRPAGWTAAPLCGVTDFIFVSHLQEVIRSHMHVTGSGPFGGFGSVCKQVKMNASVSACLASCLYPHMLLLCMSCAITTEARLGKSTGTTAAFCLVTLHSTRSGA